MVLECMLGHAFVINLRNAPSDSMIACCTTGALGNKSKLKELNHNTRGKAPDKIKLRYEICICKRGAYVLTTEVLWAMHKCFCFHRNWNKKNVLACLCLHNSKSHIIHVKKGWMFSQYALYLMVCAKASITITHTHLNKPLSLSITFGM